MRAGAACARTATATSPHERLAARAARRRRRPRPQPAPLTGAPPVGRPRRAPAPARAAASAAGACAGACAGADRRRRWRCVVACSALIGAGAYLALQSVYFIGTNDRGLVTLYRGLPYRPAGRPGAVQQRLRLGRERVDADAGAPPHAARPLAALGRRRGVADPQPRTRAARMRSAREPADRAPVRARVVLFALLLAFTSRWTIFEASSLRDNPLNARALLEQQRIDRGRILAADGTVLARSVRRRLGARKASTNAPIRRPTSSRTRSATTSPTSAGTGLERFRNAALNGQSGTNLQTILDQLQGKQPRRATRSSRRSTRRPSRSANTALGGTRRRGRGAATRARGAVTRDGLLAGYDPNALRSTRSLRTPDARPQRQPLVNRATQFGYAPGSTFKVVTATAAIDSGEFTPDSTVDGRNDVPISGVPLQNDENESFGPITLTQALAQIGQHGLGAGRRAAWASATMARYMRRFGFDRKPRLDYPARRDVHQRRVQRRAPDLADEPAGRRGAHGHRPGQTRGHAAADGRGRGGGRQPRAADGAPHDATGSSTRDGRTTERISPQRAVGRDEALDGSRRSRR